MKPIFVTGATGAVGSEVVVRLRKMGQPVRAGARHPEQHQGTPGDGVEMVSFDFARPATFPRALEGVEQVFLMRPPAIADTKRYINPFIDAAVAAGVQHMVFLSLLGAEKIPIVPHHHIERYLQHSGIRWTFLRPSFFMQNLTTTHVHDIRDENSVIVPAGHGRTSFIDARDIADVAALTLTHPGHDRQAYALTGSEALTYDEVASILRTVLGRSIIYTHPSVRTFIRHQRSEGVPINLILVMVGIYLTARLGLAATVTTDLTRLLGRPPTSFRQFAIEYQALWRHPVAFSTLA